VSFDEPLVTVVEGRPIATGRWSWQSAPLTDGQAYRFTIRTATAPWPDGLETQNTDAQAATADVDQPAAPDLTAVLA